MNKYRVVLDIELEDGDDYNGRFIECCIDHNLETIDGIKRIDIIKLEESE